MILKNELQKSTSSQKFKKKKKTEIKNKMSKSDGTQNPTTPPDQMHYSHALILEHTPKISMGQKKPYLHVMGSTLVENTLDFHVTS